MLSESLLHGIVTWITLQANASLVLTISGQQEFLPSNYVDLMILHQPVFLTATTFAMQITIIFQTEMEPLLNTEIYSKSMELGTSSLWLEKLLNSVLCLW